MKKPHPLSPTTTPPKKRLLPIPNPNPNPNPNPFPKKTRDLPNLSECHGCGLRINPKDRIQTLDSVWRVVLLCRNCVKLINSAQTCPYCFNEILEIQMGGCFNCRDCKRKIHGDCAVKFGGFAPWSYCSGFSVCVDCWVPKLLANSIRVGERKGKKRKRKVGLNLGEFRILEGDSRGVENEKDDEMLKDMVRDANCVERKKVGLRSGGSRVVGKSIVLEGSRGVEREKGDKLLKDMVKDACCVERKRVTLELRDSRVLVGESRVLDRGNRIKLLEDVMNDVNCVERKRVGLKSEGSRDLVGESRVKEGDSSGLLRKIGTISQEDVKDVNCVEIKKVRLKSGGSSVPVGKSRVLVGESRVKEGDSSCLLRKIGTRSKEYVKERKNIKLNLGGSSVPVGKSRGLEGESRVKEGDSSGSLRKIGTRSSEYVKDADCVERKNIKLNLGGSRVPVGKSRVLEGESRVKEGDSSGLLRKICTRSREYVKDANCVERKNIKLNLGGTRVPVGKSRVLEGESRVKEGDSSGLLRKIGTRSREYVKDANCVERKNIKLNLGGSRVPVGKSRVLEGESRDVERKSSAKSLEDVVKDANCAVEKKISAAAKAKESALRKAMVAKRAVELANNALDLMAKKDENDKTSESLVTRSGSTETSETRVADDAQLAFQLHRAINSSPKIPENFCSVNSICLDVPETPDLNGNSIGKFFDLGGSGGASDSGKLEVCINSKFNEKLDRIASEPLVCDKSSNRGSYTMLKPMKTYVKNGKRRKQFQENGEIVMAVGLVGTCSSGDHNRMNADSLSCQKEDKSSYELHLNDNSAQCLLKCDENKTVLQDGKCNGKRDQFLLKYSKRPIGLKAVSNHETMLDSDAMHLENQALAPGFPLNDSGESRTLSHVSFQSCAVNMQSFDYIRVDPYNSPEVNR